MILLGKLLFLLSSFVFAEVRFQELNITKGVSKEGKQVISLNDEVNSLGPVIRARSGDTLNLLVNNNICDNDDIELYGDLYCNTSIHFHGLVLGNDGDNLGAMHDGVPGVTQRSIPSGMSYWYNFTIPETICGTYWYHSHSSIQYGDGLRGIFVVDCVNRQQYLERVVAKLETDGTGGTLLQNLPERGLKKNMQDIIVAVTDWYKKSSVEILKEVMSPNGSPDPAVEGSMLNGDLGSVKFEVGADVEYVTLRVINTGMSGTNVLHVEGHRLCVVETDGVLTKPYMVDTLAVAVGQRFTVVIKLDLQSSARIVHGCGKMMGYVTKTHWLLRPGQEAGSDFMGRIADLPGLDRNERYREFVPVEGELLEEPSQQISLDYVFEGEKVREPYGTSMYTVNGDTMQEFIPDGVLLEGARGTRKPIELKSDQVVEIAINSIDHMTHPWHMHGHTFQVISVGRRRDGALHFNEPESKAMKRYLSDVAAWGNRAPMTRDTINIPGGSYAVIRLRADNPGFWLLHCHVEWHMAKGLGVVFAEGSARVATLSEPFTRTKEGDVPEIAVSESAVSESAVPESTVPESATTEQGEKVTSKGKVLTVYLLIMCAFNLGVWLVAFR